MVRPVVQRRCRLVSASPWPPKAARRSTTTSASSSRGGRAPMRSSAEPGEHVEMRTEHLSDPLAVFPELREVAVRLRR